MTEPVAAPVPPAPSPVPDPALAEARSRQNLPVALVAGLLVAVAGALAWAAVAVATDRVTGIVAIVIGVAVGWTVRLAGRGMDPAFSVVGAVLSVLGVALGNLFILVAFLAPELQLGYVETLGSVAPGHLWGGFLEMTEPLDFVFYGIAGYEGWKFARRPEPEVGAPPVAA